MKCQECRRTIAASAPRASGSASTAKDPNPRPGAGGIAGKRSEEAGGDEPAGDSGTSPSSSAELRDTYDLVRQSSLAITELGDPSAPSSAKRPSRIDVQDHGRADNSTTATSAATAEGGTRSVKAGADAGNSGSGGGVPPATRKALSARLRLTDELAQLLSSSHSPHAASLLGRPDAATRPADTDTDARRGVETVTTELCRDCCDALVELTRQQIDDLKREKNAYLEIEAELAKYRDGEVDVNAIQVEIEQLAAEEQELLQELRQTEKVKIALEAELKALDAEEKELEAEEESFWVSYSALSSRLATLENSHSALTSSIAHDKLTLARLQLTNVYNDSFCIGHDGGFATINGLRLGRLPGANVEWTEINAAWGQTTLLLSVLAKKCNFVFRGYVLHPKGSFSVIEKLGPDKATYELHGSGDWQVARLLQSRRFDHGMVAFLECLRQLMSYASDRDPSLRLPHAVNKDKIGEACIRLQFGQDETWTRALRHVLLTLKVLMVWVLKVTDDEAAEPPPRPGRT
ncbi:hypothetical protein V8E36_002399 [Tilletia maclaganii]